MTEILSNIDSSETNINTQEKQQEAIRNETDRLFSSLDNPNINLKDIRELVDRFATNNPEFATEFQNYSIFK